MCHPTLLSISVGCAMYVAHDIVPK